MKAGLVDLTDDDRATLYGAFLTIGDRPRSVERGHTFALWKRKGSRAFEAEQEGDTTSSGSTRKGDRERAVAFR